MITKLRTKIAGTNQNREGGAALIFAVLLVMVLLLIMVLVTSTAVTAAKTATTLSTADIYKNAAEAGVANALLEANNAVSAAGTNPLEKRRGIANATSGIMPDTTSTSGTDIHWRWYTQQVVFPGEKVGYYVYSTGYSVQKGIDEGISLRAQFVPTNVQEGYYDSSDNRISYRAPWASPFQWGLTGFSSVSLSSTSKIYSADSKYGNAASGTNTVGTVAATNGTMNIATTTATLREKSFAGLPTSGASCNGTGCNSSGTTYRDYKMSGDSTNARVAALCPSTSSYPVWVASSNNGVMNLGANSCVGGLIFDVPTTVPANWSDANALAIYNTGNTTVYSGVQLNKTNSPNAFKIYSLTGNLSVGNSANSYSTAVTNVSLSYYSGVGTCTIYNATVYFGALACANSSLLDGSTFYLDMASINSGVNIHGTGTGYSTGSRNIWKQEYIEQL